MGTSLVGNKLGTSRLGQIGNKLSWEQLGTSWVKLSWDQVGSRLATGWGQVRLVRNRSGTV